MLLLLCCSCSSPPKQADTKAVQNGEERLADFLKTARLYAWVELIGEDTSNNKGFMWLQLRDAKVYALSWPEPDPETDQIEWPAVAARGVLNGLELQLAWRNATGDADHAFYHAVSIGSFSADGRSWSGSFKQQDQPDAQELGSGDYSALLVMDAEKSRRAERMHHQLLHLIEVAQQTSGSCPVLPQHQGLPAYQLEHAGRSYQFCCPSCMDLFRSNPDAFITE